MSDINQDDIDKLLADALGEGGDAPGAGAPEKDRGPASQDDIDALFAAVADADADADGSAPAAAPEPAAPAKPVSSPPPAKEMDLAGIADQDDIDALFAAVGAGEVPAAASDEPVPAPPATPEAPEAAPDSDEDRDGETVNDPTDTQMDLLLSSIADTGTSGVSEDASDTVDLDELLREVNAAAPPPPPPPPPAPEPEPEEESVGIGGDTTVLSPDQSEALAHTRDEERPAAYAAPSPLPSPPPAPTFAPPPPAPVRPSAPAEGAAQRKEYSVLYGAGEVESVASQIGTLISSLTEKAHGYMQAWIAADSEAKELRVRALAEERRRISLESEKSVLAGQLDELRARLGELEGGRIAGEESRRTLETSFQARIRELESRVTLLTSEAESLKNELTRTRNEATGVDIESRRSRFEADRLRNEVESERMERLRMQRALENREKELQAAQAQSSGQASSLFIDELHRLVRRLESELDARSSGAHDALKQLDRIEVAEDMVPVVANIRAALMQALGADGGDDALKSLGRGASGVKGPAAVAPGRAELTSFETALATYNLTDAIDIAGTLLREARATPGVLMRKIYQCPALRRPEATDRLADAARLLEGLRTVQEAGDRSRGQETGESEVFYVHMFDYLHNLVRLKLINRMSGDIWRLFLDLRGRFSFVTSDRQWAEYRDNTLNNRNDKA